MAYDDFVERERATRRERAARRGAAVSAQAARSAVPRREPLPERTYLTRTDPEPAPEPWLGRLAVATVAAAALWLRRRLVR